MTTQAQTMGDLGPRIITGAVLAVAGFGVIWYDGGWPLLAFAAALAAIMVTELFLMIARSRYLYALVVAVFTAAGVWFSGRDAAMFAAVLFAVVIILGWALAPPHWRVVFPAYVVVIGFGGLSLFSLRDQGFWVVLWPAFVAIASDIAGYFAGRTIGGPLLWPRVSPKKTWSGTLAGWAAAALVGVLIAPVIEWQLSTAFLVVTSVVLAMAAQLGDLAESAIKRRAGVKDASHILPGHGGFLDRFDGMVVTYALVNIGWLVGIF